MDFLIQNILPYILIYKYFALFLISFLAAFMLPIPSGSLLMAASAFSSQGYFNIWWVVIVSILGNILGDSVWYVLAYVYGKKFLNKIGFHRILESSKFKLIEGKFTRHPGFIIFISRFEVLSTLSVNLLSGLGKLSYRKYLLPELVGTFMQVGIYAALGYFFEDNWQSVNTIVGKVTIIILFVFIAALLVFSNKLLARKAHIEI